MVGTLTNLPSNPPSLYVDLEGVDLCRYGTISILQIFVLPTNKTYLVDVYTLRGQAFSRKTRAGISLQSVLESPDIPKVFFDVRNDSDALCNLYHIELRGVHDVQLMELASRPGWKKWLKGLAKCIDTDLPLTIEERASCKAVKEKGLKLFAPEHGGSYEVFNARPLSADIIRYCAHDVEFLPKLWKKYDQRLNQTWKARVSLEVGNRLWLAWSPTYKGNVRNRERAWGPTAWW
ncbi:uncharacterized protein BP01DRAFT_287814 [Aspergillus saccharolyticus JOP 1030-1]|uniref:3'-5' exonuclease domain-containing protein n=1 Tax=Aspergillus saccharolyticus JOP 1030-1 TaxID=1450539 RepID=A0A318ZP49_9EURO|nr:hypothetical protein BP01DRAFT_287814 [Aspergillus saccharolyticus JOP 1030-1]PYH49316.1 hypothetical protein BP01DRAFT_287814 [Aspergillus saccharolyticus JOP 1030-1]